MSKTFIIAEAGVNHNGSTSIAKKIIDVAKKGGADAVKFQTFIAKDLVTFNADKAEYQKKNTNIDESQFYMLRKLELSRNQHKILFDYCQKKKIEFMSTAFDLQSLIFLNKNFNIKRFKIASPEITNAPLLIEFGKLKKKIILSTGMANTHEIEEGLSAIAFGLMRKSNPSKKNIYKSYKSIEGKNFLKKYVTLLHCTSEYPTKLKDTNLNCIETLRNKFKLDIGYSDHTNESIASMVAVSKGATIIEKHITLDKKMHGPDHSSSLEPIEFFNFVKNIRLVEKSLGINEKKPTLQEIKTKKIVRKSIVAIKPISKGDKFTDSNISIKRPGTGISPFKYFEMINTRSKKDYLIDEIVK